VLFAMDGIHAFQRFLHVYTSSTRLFSVTMRFQEEYVDGMGLFFLALPAAISPA
jgi:hypothetical protein